jgi:hypothetical protein
LLEALARVRHDPVLLGARQTVNRVRVAAARDWWKRFLPRRPRDFAGIALAAAMFGIVLNALVFQHNRHRPPSVSAAERAPSTGEIAAPVASEPPPKASAEPGAPAPAVRSEKPRDPIAGLLTGSANRDQQHLVSVAQTALGKLGYPVKGGADTLAALREYEKAHGFPPSTEITPRVVRLLVAAANAAPAR